MLIDGKKIADEILAGVAVRVGELPKPPRLAAVLVGDHAGGKKFLELKRSAAKKVGIDFRLYEFPAAITSQQLRKKVVEIAKAQVNSAVLVELPLPGHTNTQYILNAIPEEKDLDVLSQKSQGAFFAGRSKILPPAVEAVKTIFEKHAIEARGKNCAVFGYGLLVGKPISHWLAAQGATVSIINEFTANPEKISRQADILISGVGKPNLIKADMIKEGAVVIDFGCENMEGKAVGDVAFDQASPKCSLITPVPGGVGPIVIAAVLKNLITLNS
ncbi:MAG: bifunctional 5,10-methylenetetrahydrofolate dehydrogenase/5,10-methenyltetrahydrofolate cyclohydrolase [Parcubacteria group bacterium]|nr:bifunctional 5,10-methylenetetrahydrofolate dehydrogenase/5,10-methenyltetrahydrofolate cyclohydrolase [Parcubacteria group bacterium]